ncbi:MAG TPA: hemerythrin, partial [Oxalobacteraceae bacterium]|nr:hemerythrin [Oxalobacteraceae bacterium]
HVRAGIGDNAAEIAKLIVSMSSTIKLHLAVEDSILYPALQSSNNSALAMMGKRFQDEMKNIASGYLNFAAKWNSASKVSQNPELFRADANSVLKVLHERMQKENKNFYPAIEAQSS